MFTTKFSDLKIEEIACVTNTKLIDFRYPWAISNFCFLDNKRGEPLLSPVFSMGKSNEYKWQLKFFPRGDLQSNDRAHFGEDISLHLICLKPVDKHEFEAKVKFTLCTDSAQVVHDTLPQFHTFKLNRPAIRLSKLLKRHPLINSITSDIVVLICDISIVDGEFQTIAVNPELALGKVPESPFPEDDFTFHDLLASSRLSDVTLIAACGREFRGHKAILAGRSAVFLAMFEHEMKEQRENRVNIEDMDGVVLNEMLQFIYTGKSTMLDSLAEGLLAAADKYQLEGLKSPCIRELERSLSVENATKRLIIADLHRAVNLKTCVLRFISSHAKEVLETESFKSTNKTHPHLINEVLITAMKKIDLSL